MRIRFLSLIALAFASYAVPAFPCSCVPPPPSAKTPRDIVQWYAHSGDAIFEGKVQSEELRWPLIQTPVGGLISADLEEFPPVLQVTFEVSRSYKGVKGTMVTVTTGVGGGDCGFDFEIGRQYLVYAYLDDSGQLSTGICSGTGLLEDSQPDLSFLRGEPADSETSSQNASDSTAKLCGHLVGSNEKLNDGELLLFRVGNKSPVPIERAEVADDSSFCFKGASPGTYRLAFTRLDGDSPISFAWYPGTFDRSQSSTIKLTSGDSQTGLFFDIPLQSTFSVRGSVQTSNNAPLPPETKVFLMNADLSAVVAYAEDVEVTGFFKFPAVLPGKYWAMVGVDAGPASKSSWATRKTEVQVTGVVDDLFLELIQK
jgi:hypothetical protein